MILHRVARNVADLAAAQEFYEQALGCVPLGPVVQNAVLARTLDAEMVYAVQLQLGQQCLELSRCVPPGAPYPLRLRANDRIFQHIAIVTTDIAVACARALRHGAAAISHDGPQTLPAAAGGVMAWKFRDPDGHPLEFLQFPSGGLWEGESLLLGYDHSALCVSDVARSIGFYQRLGLRERHRQHNHGPAQDRLDGLAVSSVDVVNMGVADGPPHVELLGYRGEMFAAPQPGLRDVAADRLVFRGKAKNPDLARDPDGHVLLFEPAS